MADPEDVRRIALSLPDTRLERPYAYSVRRGARYHLFCWPWLERIQPKKARVANPSVLGVRVKDELDKFALTEFDPETFFTEPHYDGYPAILVRLANIHYEELTRVIVSAWRLQAPTALVKQYDVNHSGSDTRDSA